MQPRTRRVVRAVPLDIQPQPGASEALVIFGRSYWALHGLSAAGIVQWVTYVKALTPPMTGQAHHVAGLGVRATASGYRCSSCQGDLVLTARVVLESALAGEPVRCRGCSPRFLAKVRELAAAASDVSSGTVVADPLRVKLEQRYPLQFTPDAPIPLAGVRQELLVLGMLRRGSPLRDRLPAAADSWHRPVAPQDLTPLWLAIAQLGGLLRVHPASRIEAFARPADDASTERSGHHEADPMLVEHYVPFGRDAADGAERLERHLTTRLLTARLDIDGGRAMEFRSAVAELLGHECLDFARRRLPASLPPHLALRVLDAIGPVLRSRTLGHAFAVIWRAVPAMIDHVDDNANWYDDVDERVFTTRWWEAGMVRLENAAAVAERSPGGITPFTDLRGDAMSATTQALGDLLDVDPFELGVPAEQPEQAVPES